MSELIFSARISTHYAVKSVGIDILMCISISALYNSRVYLIERPLKDLTTEERLEQDENIYSYRLQKAITYGVNIILFK